MQGKLKLLNDNIMVLLTNCEVYTAKYSLFIFTCYIKTVPVYDFKLVGEVSCPSVKERIFQNNLLRAK